MIFNILIPKLHIYYTFTHIVFLSDSSHYNGTSTLPPTSRHNVLFEDYIKEDKDYIDDFTGPDDLWGSDVMNFLLSVQPLQFC